MVTQKEIDKAAEEHDEKTPIKDLTIDKLFKAGVAWVLNKLNTQSNLQDEIDYWYKETGSLTSEVIIRRAYILGLTKGNDLSKVTRFEVIDHSNTKQGRFYVKRNCKIELSLQDNNRTLKIFLNDE